jgi:hypothetical protein
MTRHITTRLRPIFAGLALLMIAQTGFTPPAHAQRHDTAWTAQHQAECRLAHQVLTTGQPAVRHGWAVARIGGCPQGGEALAAELRRLRTTSERTDELEMVVRATARFVDRALVVAALEIATDASAGTVARIQAMRVISNQLTPMTLATYEDFLVPGGMGAGAFIPSSGRPGVGEPLTREIIESVRQGLTAIVEDASALEPVRIAADNVAGHAHAELEKCPDEPWFVYWGPC